MTRRGQVGPQLHVLMHGREIAHLTGVRAGKVKLTYLPDALEVTRGLSCCLPAVGVQFAGERVENWIGGLLPDRSEVLTRWRARYELQRQDTYALLWHVGEDVAGAARFVRPDRVHVEDSESEPLCDEAIGARVTALATDATAWAPSGGTGQFSLAGAQAKFALARTDAGWVEPTGSRPTTHIFKPAIPAMPDQDLNEHLTMGLAAAVGLPVARTELLEFAGSRVLVVARFDRYIGPDGSWQRVHQEDAVQALGLSPARKYEQHGGPGVRDVVGLLRTNVSGEHAQGDIATFIDAVAFNWLTVGTDAHARNYALMHHGPHIRLAPLYDLNSFLPYAAGRPASLSMQIGFSERDPARVTAGDWEELARDCRVDADQVISRVRGMAGQLLAVADAVLTDESVRPWKSPLPDRLCKELAAHIRACRRRL
jgi:serine/threonine-protein kinase HipA